MSDDPDMSGTDGTSFDHVFDAAEKIVEDVAAETRNGSVVRLFFPGGPLDVIAVHGRGEWTDLVIEGQPLATIHTRSIVGWQLLG